MKISLLLGWTAIVASGCGGSPSTGDGGAPSGDGSTPDAPRADGPLVEAATGVCNALVNIAPSIPITLVASDPPVLQGGVTVDATYVLTDITIYTGLQGPAGVTGTSQTTIQITGTTIQVVSNGAPTTRTETLATAGTSFTASTTCPNADLQQGTYTATPTSLVVEVPAGAGDAGARTLVETFTKQ
jgi:hypothetical protein